MIEHLTAIRLYAAGARRALTNGTPEQIEFALGKIEEQACRAHDLLREIGQHGGPGRAR